MADRNGVGVFRKVHPGDQHVGGHHQLLAGRYIEDSGVITDAERDIRTRNRLAREVARDEFELVQVILFSGSA